MPYKTNLNSPYYQVWVSFVINYLFPLHWCYYIPSHSQMSHPYVSITNVASQVSVHSCIGTGLHPPMKFVWENILSQLQIPKLFNSFHVYCNENVEYKFRICKYRLTSINIYNCCSSTGETIIVSYLAAKVIVSWFLVCGTVTHRFLCHTEPSGMRIALKTKLPFLAVIKCCVLIQFSYYLNMWGQLQL